MLGGNLGWRASQGGEQRIRIIFDESQRVHHILLLFEEGQQQRTQEFALHCSSDDGQSYHEI